MNREKVSLAWAIAHSKTMDQTWIPNRLNMRSAANVSQQIRRFEKNVTGNSIFELKAGYNLSRIVD
jgi:hypothetical protein